MANKTLNENTIKLLRTIKGFSLFSIIIYIFLFSSYFLDLFYYNPDIKRITLFPTVFSVCYAIYFIVVHSISILKKNLLLLRTLLINIVLAILSMIVGYADIYNKLSTIFPMSAFNTKTTLSAIDSLYFSITTFTSSAHVPIQKYEIGRYIMRLFKIGKVTTFLGGIMMIAILLCCSNQVQAAQDGDYTYTVTADEAQITGYTGVGGVVTIPSTLAGVPVTSIGNNAFFQCTGLTSISIPQGVTSICIGAFTGCSRLTSISIPQGVTSIGLLAFDGCAALTSISIPEGVTIIGDEAFVGCTGLTSISIPQGVTNIGDYTFFGCTGLTSISIPQGVTSIGDSAFVDCIGLTSIIFNSVPTTIYDCSDTIPASTKIIGYDPSTAKDYATEYNRTFEVIGQ